ncbi:YecA family protein [Neptuniibacter sp.]|uniref:YecA/YgfB family protein n=1 Tax=Neptuniibacter sp. TaxID=1962643 RepID=UPI002619FF0C|nr:YecA family protein [Neptuniibacter sp.]MCP4598654.1 YecA family protein [Neptuniibacter sp.]
MTLTSANVLSDAELDQLDGFLYSDLVSEDCLDLIGVHGLFSALNISPSPMDDATLQELVFDEEPKWESEEQKQTINTLLQRFYSEIGGNLYSDGEIELPCELSLDAEEGEDISPLAWWAQAFMEGVFTQEEVWFNKQTEQDVAEMLLPVMVASDLFDEADINKIRDDEKLCAEMCAQIPELLIDLYLYFHAPEK